MLGSAVPFVGDGSAVAPLHQAGGCCVSLTGTSFTVLLPAAEQDVTVT